MLNAYHSDMYSPTFSVCRHPVVALVLVLGTGVAGDVLPSGGLDAPDDALDFTTIRAGGVRFTVDMFRLDVLPPTAALHEVARVSGAIDDDANASLTTISTLWGVQTLLCPQSVV